MRYVTAMAVLTAIAVAFGVAFAAPASAQIIVGAPATGYNFIPFGSTAGYPEYQQVYASSDFSGTITIDDIEFYTVAGSGTGTPNTGLVTISLSTTSAAVNGLNTNLSLNLGSNNTMVYDATLPAVQSSGVLDIPLSTPFTYNPADGNLLVDIVEATSYTGGPGFEFNSASGGVFSRGFSGQTIPVNNDSGLVTGFSVTPLPAALPLFTTGLGALGLLGWRRKRTSPRTICHSQPPDQTI